MLEGWYCRSMANQQTEDNEMTDDSQEQAQNSSTNDQGILNIRGESDGGDYKARYRQLKRKFKFLVYENEYFQDTLRFNQRRLLKISKDRAFLLDRLLQYEKPGNTSSEDDATESSDDDTATRASQNTKETIRKRKLDGKGTSVNSAAGGATRGRKRKIPGNQGNRPSTPVEQKQEQKLLPPPPQQQQQQQLTQQLSIFPSTSEAKIVETQPQEIHLTTAEITRQLQARKPSAMEWPSATVPATMLSDESPSKCFQTDQPQHYLDGSSPSHVAAEECVPMEYIN